MTAVAEGAGPVLSGVKRLVVAGAEAQALVVAARSEEGAPALFLVEGGAAGLAAGQALRRFLGIQAEGGQPALGRPGLGLAGRGEAAAGGFFKSISTWGVRNPGTEASAVMHSRWICWETLGSATASESLTKTSSPRTSADSTKPNDTISRLKPGYFTDLSASRTISELNCDILR
jgi:hypothetical protein